MDFLSLYKEYATEITDAPIEFHDYIGMATIGIVLGNKAFFPFGDGNIYPNFWVLLLAPSSAYRKTTALNISRRLLYDFDSSKIYPSEFSHEKIIDVLSNNPAGVFYYSEFTTLMGLLSRDYMAGTKSFLTDIFDGGMSYKREIRKEKFEIHSPAVSILSASTLDWFLQGVKEADLRGGFLPRFLIVPASSKTKTIPIPPMADKEKRAKLVEMLRRFQNITGGFYLSPEARSLHAHWYNSLTTIERYDSFVERLQIYVLKIAMVLEVNNSQSTKISEKTMKQAINYTNYIINCFKKIASDELIYSKSEKNIKKVRDMIKTKGEINRKDLLRETRLISTELDRIIQTLIEREEIVVVKTKTLTKPLVKYRWQEKDSDF